MLRDHRLSVVIAGNLFEDTGPRGDGERFNTLVACEGVRIERIVSHGHASPPGFWYDQPQDEWVVVLAGSADLRIEGEVAVRRLERGDHLLIPAHCRHRVDRTDDETVWLAVHVEPRTSGQIAG